MLEFTKNDIWSGRFDDEDGELGVRVHQKVKLQNFAESTFISEPNIAFLGFCSDEGVRRNKGRVGAKNAPNHIRKALANLPFPPTSTRSIFDFGNILLKEQNLESARHEQIECISDLLLKNYFPIVLGGGHETALGNFLAMAETFPNLGIINIDAHFDLRIPIVNSTSGTPFFEMAHYCHQNEREFNYFTIGIQPTGNTFALFNRAEELKVETVLADEVHIDLNYSLRKVEDFIQRFDVIYLSLDLDVLDAAFAPGVSAPSANGLSTFQVKSIIQTVLESGKLKLFDVVELNPDFDIDNRTAKVAAHLVSEFLK